MCECAYGAMADAGNRWKAGEPERRSVKLLLTGKPFCNAFADFMVALVLVSTLTASVFLVIVTNEKNKALHIALVVVAATTAAGVGKARLIVTGDSIYELLLVRSSGSTSGAYINYGQGRRTKSFIE